MVADSLERKADITANYTPNLTAFLEERVGSGIVTSRVRNSRSDELAFLVGLGIYTYELYIDGTSTCLGTVKIEELLDYNELMASPYAIIAKVKIPSKGGWILPWPFQRWATLSYEGRYETPDNFVHRRTDNHLEIPFP